MVVLSSQESLRSVVKIGGKCLASGKHIQRMAKALLNMKEHHSLYPIIVCSSIQTPQYDVDDILENACQLALEKQHTKYALPYAASISILERLHIACIREALRGNPELASLVEEQVFIECEKLREFLSAIRILGEVTDRSRDIIMACGPKLSGMIMQKVIESMGVPSVFVDSSCIYEQNPTEYSHPDTCFQALEIPLEQLLQVETHQFTSIAVVQGHVGSVGGGLVKTKGIKYLDVTSAVLASSVKAVCIEYWTSVNGLASANPDDVSDCIYYPLLSFAWALTVTKLSGCKRDQSILHPEAVQYASSHNIPICIRNGLALMGDMKADILALPRTDILPLANVSPLFITLKLDATIIIVKQQPHSTHSDQAVTSSLPHAGTLSKTLSQINALLTACQMTSDLMTISSDGCVSLACVQSTCPGLSVEKALERLQMHAIVRRDRCLISVALSSSQGFSHILAFIDQLNIPVEMISYGTTMGIETLSLALQTDTPQLLVQQLHTVLLKC